MVLTAAGDAFTSGSRAGQAERFIRPSELRGAARRGEFTRTTSGHCPGYAQANIAVVPRQYADGFKAYCVANPAPLPLLGVFSSPMLPGLGRDIDVRTDVPAYEGFDGERTFETTDVTEFWRADYVTFAIGCSFGFEHALAQVGVPIRNVEEGRTVSMYDTNIPTVPRSIFGGSMVVSMRPLRPEHVDIAHRVTASLSSAHGAPVYVGRDCAEIGIADLAHPEYGDPVTIYEDDTPVFWPCGVTASASLRRAGIRHIVHKPGHMLVTDLRLS